MPIFERPRREPALVVEAPPLVVTALVVLVLASAATGREGFGIALGFEGLALGLWGVVLAVDAAQSSRELGATAGAIDASVVDLRATAADLSASARAEREILARLLDREELDILRAIHRAAPQLWSEAQRIPLPGAQWPPGELRLDAGTRRRHLDALGGALEDAVGIPLPLCSNLFLLLLPGGRIGEDKVRPDLIDFRPIVEAADAELRAAMAERQRRLRRRPPSD